MTRSPQFIQMGSSPIIKETQTWIWTPRWEDDTQTKQKDMATRQGSQPPPPDAGGGQGWSPPKACRRSKTPPTSDLISDFSFHLWERTTRGLLKISQKVKNNLMETTAEWQSWRYISDQRSAFVSLLTNISEVCYIEINLFEEIVLTIFVSELHPSSSKTDQGS